MEEVPLFYGVEDILVKCGLGMNIIKNSRLGDNMAFNALRYLRYFGFKRITPRGENIMASCPDFYSKHERGDLRPSFGIHTETGLCHCFRCGLDMNLIQLTKELLSRKLETKVNELQALNWLEDKGWLPKQKTPEDIQKQLEEIQNPEDELTFYEDSILDEFRNGVHPSIIKLRGITIEGAKEWELRYDENTKRTIIPVRNQSGRLVGCMSHSTDINDYIVHAVGIPQLGDKKAKYTFKKRYVLFGEHKAQGKDTAIVVESPLDIIYAYSHGLHEEADLFAIFGAIPSKYQINYLMGYKEVIEALDNDGPGREGGKQLQEALKGKVKLRTFDHFGRKDLGDIPVERLKYVTKSAKMVLPTGLGGLNIKYN